VAHYLAGESYTYPRVIANQLYAAVARGASADSVRAFYQTLVARSQAEPAAYSHSRAAMAALKRRLEKEGKSEMAAVVKELRGLER
jgi:hypothetical protein